VAIELKHHKSLLGKKSDNLVIMPATKPKLITSKYDLKQFRNFLEYASNFTLPFVMQITIRKYKSFLNVILNVIYKY